MNIFMERADHLFKLLFVNIQFTSGRKCFDLKHDPDIYLNMPVKDLDEAMKKNPKFLRTIRHNKHPVV